MTDLAGKETALRTGFIPRITGVFAAADTVHRTAARSFEGFLPAGRENGAGDSVDPVKIPKVPKAEYDALIGRQYVSRIAFGACDEHPYVAPFMYVFDGKYLYFLSTRYGRKMEYFESDPRVSVEIEEYAPDLSAFTFVSLQGSLEEVTDPGQKREVREQFVDMIRDRGLSSRVLTAFGHTPDDAPEVILREERSMVWKLVGVQDIVALKNG